MTRENAKKQLMHIIAFLNPQLDGADIKALNMAIDALEQEPTDDTTLKDIFCTGCEYKEQESCDDAISREAAIQKIKEHSYPIRYDHNSIENGMTITGIEQALNELPSVQPSRKGHWIDVKEQMPEPLQSVIVTWKNHEPEPYYSDIKHKPFVGFAIYYRDKWWWWSAYTEDMLAEYGRSESDKVDDAIEITAWMPLPEPYKDMRGDTDADSN